MTGYWQQSSKPGSDGGGVSLFGLADMYNPAIHEIDIENGLLQGFRIEYHGHEWLTLQVDFDPGTYMWRFGGSWSGSGTLNRAPGYIDDVVVPEPQTWTLLLTGFAAIAMLGRRRRG